MIEAIKL